MYLGESEDEEESTPPSSPPVIPVRKSKFDDEEEEDSDVLESWSAAEDSEDEREKAKVEAARKAKAEAEAAANKKSKTQRIAERQAENRAKAAQAAASSTEGEDEDEDEAARRRRLQKTEQEADLKHAEDLFGTVGISNKRTATKAIISADPDDPSATIDLGALALFNPNNKASFAKLRETLVPILTASSKKAHYTIFLQEFTRDLTKDLPSGDIKAIASKLTTLSNEKMKEEKAAEKGGKKSKAAKTKTSLVASRDESVRADTTSYENEFDE
ncbi:MAG: Translation initiation factor 3 subunit J component [Trichoglossum hirsutum]|nr:MAG: Translation initiation factor 3 subunit J component [Trichoglossum hirsutum]